MFLIPALLDLHFDKFRNAYLAKNYSMVLKYASDPAMRVVGWTARSIEKCHRILKNHQIICDRERRGVLIGPDIPIFMEDKETQTIVANISASEIAVQTENNTEYQNQIASQIGEISDPSLSLPSVPPSNNVQTKSKRVYRSHVEYIRIPTTSPSEIELYLPSSGNGLLLNLIGLVAVLGIFAMQ